MYPETIEIPLPQGARLSPFDLDVLKATLVTIVTAKCQVGESSSAIVTEFENRGWHLDELRLETYEQP